VFYEIRGGLCSSDAEVVGAPGLNAGFDLLFGEVLAEGTFGEGGELGVGGEAEGDELALGEGVGGGVGHAESGEAETLFEADEAVLCLEGGVAGVAGDEEESDGEDDPEDGEVDVPGVILDRVEDGETQVQ